MRMIPPSERIQETLEHEISGSLGRDYFERNPEAKTGYRNGYEPKTIKTAEGKVIKASCIPMI